jgi:hypothetical protein
MNVFSEILVARTRRAERRANVAVLSLAFALIVAAAGVIG